MKEQIHYFYNINDIELKESNDYYYFKWNHNEYYFYKINKENSELEKLFKIVEERNQKQIKTFQPIQNQFHSFLTYINQEAYILFEYNDAKKEYSILDMIHCQRKQIINETNTILDRSNWIYLWSEKIDYLEYQVHELGKKYPIIINSFSYYIGLAENAICYAKQAQKYTHNSKKVLSHRRVFYPNYGVHYDNPLNFIVDIEVRDIGEFIKYLALENIEYALIDLKTYIETEKLNIYNLSMLFARLLYPSYYFDIHEKIINMNKPEESILKIVGKSEYYEIFLKKAWQLLRTYAPIEEIQWITKKEL